MATYHVLCAWPQVLINNHALFLSLCLWADCSFAKSLLVKYYHLSDSNVIPPWNFLWSHFSWREKWISASSVSLIGLFIPSFLYSWILTIMIFMCLVQGLGAHWSQDCVILTLDHFQDLEFFASSRYTTKPKSKEDFVLSKRQRRNEDILRHF